MILAPLVDGVAMATHPLNPRSVRNTARALSIWGALSCHQILADHVVDWNGAAAPGDPCRNGGWGIRGYAWTIDFPGARAHGLRLRTFAAAARCNLGNGIARTPVRAAARPRHRPSASNSIGCSGTLELTEQTIERPLLAPLGIGPRSGLHSRSATKGDIDEP
jgi:hypothetical protein